MPLARVKGLIVTAARESFLTAHPGIIKRYFAVQRKALEFMNKNPEKIYEIVARETGIHADDVKRMYPWYDFEPSLNSSDLDDLEETQEFLLKNGMIPKSVEINQLVTDMSHE